MTTCTARCWSSPIIPRPISPCCSCTTRAIDDVRPRDHRARALGGRERTGAKGPDGAPAMSLRPRGGERRGRRLGALRERAVLRLRARPHRADRDLGAGDGRHRLWRRVLCLPAGRSIGLDLRRSPMRAIVDAGEEIAQAVAKAVPIDHPDEPDLAFLYGTILTDGGDGKDGAQPQRLHLRRPPGRSQPDRQRRHARAWRCRWRGVEARLGDQRRFESCTGAVFTGTAVREAPPVGPRKAVIVDVGGRPLHRRSAIPIRSGRSTARRLHAVILSEAKDLAKTTRRSGGWCGVLRFAQGDRS